ncbi:unnamed protein product [Paramecium primaurelia]|uniref:Tetratricopeptide repeat protein n=1 Tax=Paramecium primaurelia TaxID=5886 RepID=A0A8S1KS84_PARPR|nr:unnamed protein product [Paramecium primaurelia]CAD8057261.1 unnamed protein product [Paramecium primaurelia]
MSQLKEFTCLKENHEGQSIEGLCLNFNCSEPSQCCFKCIKDTKTHISCKNDLLQFDNITTIVASFGQIVDKLHVSLNKSHEIFQKIYQELNSYLVNLQKIIKMISEVLTQRDFQNIKNNINFMKEAYDYLNNKKESSKQNQIKCKLNDTKKFIKTLEIEQTPGYYNLKVLKQSINLLNVQQWQKAEKLLEQHINESNKNISFAKFLQSIALIENNQPGKGIIKRDEAIKMNGNLYNELLEFVDQAFKKKNEISLYANQAFKQKPKNKFISIIKSYALNGQQKYDQAIEQCQIVLNEQPGHPHACYQKSYVLQDQNQYDQAIKCIENVFESRIQYCIGHFQKAYSLQLQGKHQEAINEYNLALNLDPNFASAYNNKGYSLNKIKQYQQAVECFDQAISIDPFNAKTYYNKGLSLQYLQQNFEALFYYTKALNIDKTYEIAYKKQGYLLQKMKKYKLAAETYEQAIQNCQNENYEFVKLKDVVIKIK